METATETKTTETHTTPNSTSSKERNPNVGVHAVLLHTAGTMMTVTATTRTELAKLVSEKAETGWSCVAAFKGKRLETQTKTKFNFS